MGYQWVWVNDDVDDKAEKLNRLTYAAAARRAGRDVKWIHRQIESGRLRTVDQVDRTFVAGASLAGLLLKTGVGPDPLEIARDLDEQGRFQEAGLIRQRAQEEENADPTNIWNRYAVSRSAEPAAEKPPDIGNRFLAKYLGKWGGGI